MHEEGMWDIYQMVNSIVLQMDEKETPETEELFEKIRWALQEMELKIVRMSNAVSIMQDSFNKFSESYKVAMDEVNWKYKRPVE